MSGDKTLTLGRAHSPHGNMQKYERGLKRVHCVSTMNSMI